MLERSLRVLVTGATGFIGFHAARHLREEGHTVRALVRDTEKAERVLGLIGVEAGDRIVGDMTDEAAVAQALEGCDAVIHAAAGVSVTQGQTDFSANLSGTQNVVGAACGCGLHTLYISSLLAIFHPAREINEDSALVRSNTHYGRSKTECDAWVRAKQEAGAPLAIVYPPGVVGPDDPGMSESVKAYRSFLRGTLRSEGGNQMLDVRDLALLLVRMLEAKSQGRVIAAGHFFDWDEFTQLLEQVTGAKIPRIRAPGWLLRGAARTLDVVGKLTGRTMPMTGEGVEIATRFRKISDSPQIAELGIRWRNPKETLTDLFRWLVASGKLPVKAVPGLDYSDTKPLLS